MVIFFSFSLAAKFPTRGPRYLLPISPLFCTFGGDYFGNTLQR